jgi:carboxylesterase
MSQISGLVDHSANYVPIQVPIPALPTYEKVGVLLLHGFTSHLNTVNGLIPHLEKAGIEYEMPILRGHGTQYQDMLGVTAHDWFDDAEHALLSLSERVDRVVVVGLSMGGLVGLELAMRHADKIAGLVTVAAAVKFADPSVGFSPLLAKVFKYWPSPESFNDLSRKVNCKNYPRFATDSFLSLYKYSQYISDKLPEVKVPVCILQSKKDQVVAPEAANTIYERVGSLHREIHWYKESGHEMMQDLEAEKVFSDIMGYVMRFTTNHRADKTN